MSVKISNKNFGWFVACDGDLAVVGNLVKHFILIWNKQNLMLKY